MPCSPGGRGGAAYIFLMRTAALVAALFAILGAAIWFAYAGSTTFGGTMTTHGYIAMAIGIFFSLVVGCGLMALVFYSSRRGYDEPARREQNPPEA